MACYAINPVLLYTTGCLRTVCIHCRVEFRLSALVPGHAPWVEQILRTPPPDVVIAP